MQIYKYFTANGMHKYVDVLDSLIEKYNNSKHRSIGMTPVEAGKPENHEKVFRHLYAKNGGFGRTETKVCGWNKGTPQSKKRINLKKSIL